MTRPRKILLLLGITLLAAFLRLYQINALPPSAGYDQASYGLDALAILRGARPVFFESNFGREALFSYWVALCLLLIRNTTTAIYLASALAGILTIPAVYLAADEMLSAEKGALGRYGALLAALILAISYWHQSWSRLGMRVILVPLFATLAVYLLWKGQRTGSNWAFVGCGLALGLGLHSYQAARALPLLVLLGFAYTFRARRSCSKSDLLHVGLVLIAAAVVFAPLGYYFWTHPGSASQRIEQTLVVGTQQPQDSMRQLFSQVQTTLLAFSMYGDTDPRVTIPGRPALDPFLSLVWIVGIAISLARIRKPSYLFLLTWLAGLTAPAFLAQYGAMTKRAIGALPAVAILAAVGCLVTWDALRRWISHVRPSWSTRAGPGLALFLACGLIYSGIHTYRGYFLTWSQDPNLFTHFEAGPSAIGDYLKGRPQGERIYLSPVPADHASVLLGSNERQGVKTYHGRFCLVLPYQAAHDTTFVIVPAEDQNSLQLLREYLPQGRMAGEGPLHYQLPYFLAYSVPAGAELQLPSFEKLEVNWDNRIRLWGYELDRATYKPGDTIHLTLYYGSSSDVGRNYTVFTHLLGPHNQATGSPIWAQSDSEPCKGIYQTSAWDTDEMVIDHFSLTIPPETPAGPFELEMGFYDWQTLERLPVLDSAGRATGDHVLLTRTQVTTQP